ncbi:beta-ketoacyl-ACP synthase II [Alkalimarinus alittae]|uniref:3-oxoacyl-[acyl-carrier-protein] synthase 2 n=1 Tax=Alkalimarinus alittae TaxID=2961619 RepID=A0ABY6MXY6_9ALTE|nr:beta-ketoacyl-ACP synthase II [Alkalimarinus alittae]UZE94694.1 beta-ketoacyl-ACP synthase II [Alkalimarinus alittae]
MALRRVVVTGTGMLSPLGNNTADSWDAAIKGVSGIGYIDNFDTERFATKIGGAVKGLDIEQYLSKKDIRKIDRFMQYGLVAAIQAVESAGLDTCEDEALLEKVGVAIGSGIGGLETIENNYKALLDGGPRKVSPFFVPGSVINMIAGNLAIRYGFKGPNIAITTACTTGTHNIGYAARTIAYGDADIMLAGGAEMATTPTGLASFCSARALSTRNDEPERASRPWDKDRDGFVLSDGAGVIVLEELECAKKRGANILCELVGFGMSDDAFHITSPSANGEGAQLSMKRAINDASLNTSQIGYINAHGTSTSQGDIAECRAIKAVFGSDAPSLKVSSTKSMTGHLLGAAGAVEAIFCINSILHNIVPPTINLENPDDECDLNFVANKAQEGVVNYALSNSFGFGGTNGSLLFAKFNG